MEKEKVENERNGYANKKTQIEKRNNQVVVKIINTPRIKC